MKKVLTYLLLFSALHAIRAQETSVSKGDVALNVSMGVPHLFKGLTKVIVKSQAFQNNFNGYVEIGNVTGMNPLYVKGEYTFTKWFALGLNYASWDIGFDVTDHYNLQRQSAGQILHDSVDIYKVKISSKSFGIRPIIHFNLKNSKNNFFIAFGIGLTSNSIGISFESTDAGRTLGPIASLLSHDLSIPGSTYIAPTLGYRHYFNDHIGFNIEAGYDKGALLLGGVAAKFNVLKKK